MADKSFAVSICDVNAIGAAIDPSGNSAGITGSHTGLATMRFFRRRKFIVNRKLQYHFLMISLLYASFFACSIAAFLFIPLIIQLHSLDPMSADASQPALEFLYLHANYWPAVIISFAIIALHSIATSHKVAGPLYRFSRIFNAIKRGCLPKPIRLRKGDYLQDEMEQLNQMIGSLRTRLEEIRKAQADLCFALSAYCQDIDGELSEEQRELLKELESKGRILKEKLSGLEIEA
jgi:methyl-accepting chemotaxis protein